MQRRLEGKVAIVTGASSGIGRATALAFARVGASVVAVARRAEELATTVEAAEAAGTPALACAADVTREPEVASVVERTLARFGRLDIAFNAAGGSFPGALTHQLREEDFRAWLDSYLVGTFLTTKHALGAMLRSGGGSIIHVGTFVGHTMAFPGTAGYAAAKTGLFGLTRTVAAEYATQGIRANLLLCGGVDTPAFRLWNGTGEQRAGAAQLHAMKRVADPGEVASAAVFLASSEASFVTGSVLTVDGGQSLV